MNQNATVGSKIKELRLEHKYTLKQLAEETGLSVGFLSQLERGMSSIAIDSLAKIADIFGVGLTVFFEPPADQSPDPVVRGFDPRPVPVSEEIVQFILSRDKEDFTMLPRLFQLMPFANTDAPPGLYGHEGEEFIYVLEGVVTVYLEEREYTLYPGDSIQIHSAARHNWMNRTNKIARLLSVNSPNPFGQKGG